MDDSQIEFLDLLFGRLTIWALALATAAGIIVKIVRRVMRNRRHGR
jgi:hypothetical protein